jgi:hypothetical protein
VVKEISLDLIKMNKRQVNEEQMNEEQMEGESKFDFGLLWSVLDTNDEYQRVFENLSDGTDLTDVELESSRNSTTNEIFIYFC